MANDNFDLGSIGNLLSSLSAEDMENLKGAAQTLFSSQEAPKKEAPPPPQSNMDFSSFAKIASIMSALSAPQSDPRCDLLKALRPMLSSSRQQKIDQAIKMLQLLTVLPKLKELNI